MKAIFYREMKAYFSSLLAWMLIAAFLFVAGVFLMMGVNYYADISASSMQGGVPCNINVSFVPPMVQLTGLLLLFFLPLLTMRSFAEDKRIGTLDLLFTYPISDWEIVLGKFFAVMVVPVIMLALTIPVYLFVGSYCSIEWPILASGYLALLLMAASMCAMGLFTSSLTSSQLVASALNYGGFLFLWFLGVPDQSASYTAVLGKLSILSHLESLAKGVVNSQDIIYYVALTGFFLYLTVRFIESRKWRG